jgi:flagellar biosynthesis/type III secretory pathway chaperone
MDPLQQLIAVLREELQNYGELLALLDRQQELVVERAAGELLAIVGGIQQQATALQLVRDRRENCRRTLATALLLPAETAFAALIDVLPPDYRPLVQALVQENNELLVRVQQRARQNHLLLSRSVDLMQRFLNMLLPGSDAGLYTDSGQNRPGLMPASAVYNAVG